MESYDLNEIEDIEVGSIPGTPEDVENRVPQSNKIWIESGPKPISPHMDSHICLHLIPITNSSQVRPITSSPQPHISSSVTPISLVDSSSMTSSSIGGGSSKWYRSMLTDLYKNTDRLLLIHDNEDQTSYT